MIVGEHVLPAWIEGLFREHGGYLHRAARHLGAPVNELEDIVQEIFLIAHRRRHEFEGRSAPRTWLHGICVRVVANARRRAHHHREKVVANVPDGAVDSDLEHASDVVRARAALEAALESLDDDKRTVFVLVDIEELPVDDVARITEVPVKTVYSRLYAGRAAVLDHMKRTLGTGRRKPE